MTDLDTIKAALEKAHTELHEICDQGVRDRWRMHIPAQPDRDSDLIIADALRHADGLLAEVRRLTADLPTGELYDRILAEITNADADSPAGAACAAYDAVLPVLANLDIQVRQLTEDRDRARAEIEEWKKSADNAGLAIAKINRERGEAQDRATEAEADRDRARALAGVRGDLFDEATKKLERAQQAGNEIWDDLNATTADRDRAREIAAALEAETARIRELHSEYRLYDDCGHEHAETDEGVVNVPDVGVVCQDGYMYSVCRECCTNGYGDQTEECASAHDHPGWLCATNDILRAAEAGEGA